MWTRSNSDLVLGWEVNKGLDPEYWIKADAAPGRHSIEHLVTVPRPEIAHHTVIVAQSGSGKSYFLGRVIEEILLKTLARVVIFDPNSDFRKVALAVSAEEWKKAKYDVTKRRGFLPDEESADLFIQKWKAIDKEILSARLQPVEKLAEQKINPLAIDWTGISTEVLSGDFDPLFEDELRRCHELVRTISRIIADTKPPDWTIANDLIDVSRRLCALTREKDGQPMEQSKSFEIFQREFPFDETKAKAELGPIEAQKKRTFVDLRYHQAAIHRGFIRKDMENFYFSNALAIRASGLLRQSNKRLSGLPPPRLQVIDLPSIEEPRFRPWVVSTLLQTEWTRARDNWERALDETSTEGERVPTFIVLDEAHNLAPLEPRNHSEKGLLEQFRRVAAEGRKFGLFLILVSQRPDKLDTLVVSECENRAVMRVGSDAVLKKTKELLGLDDIPSRMIERCLEFDVGRALLAGAWVNGEPTLLYGAARRTQEGGKNLNEKHWTTTVAEREACLVKTLKRSTPLIEVIQQLQDKLTDQEATIKITQQVLDQYRRLQQGVDASKRFESEKDKLNAVMTAERPLNELRIATDKVVYLIETSEGPALVVKTAPNTFRITFLTAARIAPEIAFLQLPAGMTANVVEKSTVGFTAAFTPLTVPVERLPTFVASAVS
jgi:uncharacterized protein DUF87